MKLSHKRQDGFTMVECVVAIMIINLTIAGMFQLLKLQERQVTEAEGWLKKNPVFYLNPDPDPIARALGKPASLDENAIARNWKDEVLPYEVRIIDFRFELDPAILKVEFEQAEAEPQNEEENPASGKKEKKAKPKKKGLQIEASEEDLLKEGKARMRRNQHGEDKSARAKKRRPRR